MMTLPVVSNKRAVSTSASNAQAYWCDMKKKNSKESRSNVYARCPTDCPSTLFVDTHPNLPDRNVTRPNDDINVTICAAK